MSQRKRGYDFTRNDGKKGGIHAKIYDTIYQYGAILIYLNKKQQIVMIQILILVNMVISCKIL